MAKDNRFGTGLPGARKPGQMTRQALAAAPSFSYYKVGSRLECEINSKKIICYVDDITTHRRELNGPALFFVSPPFSAGALQTYLREAAQTTHGVKHVELLEVYTAIHELIRDEDAAVWIIPNRDTVCDFFIDRNYNIIYNVCGEGINLAINHNAFFLIEKNIPLLNNLHKNDNYANFDIVFNNCSLGNCEFIFDPCAGWGPLMKTSVERDVGYYGVEISSIKGINYDRIERFVNKYNGSIISTPDSVVSAPGRIVEGAVNDQFLDPKDIPDMTLGRKLLGKRK